MPYKDPERERKYKADWHQARKIDNDYKTRLRLSKPAARKRARKYINEQKAKTGCLFCGEQITECLDFHHVRREEKRRDVCQMGCAGLKTKTIQEELDKCVVLCANHHRFIEAAIKLRKSNPELFDKLLAQ